MTDAHHASDQCGTVPWPPASAARALALSLTNGITLVSSYPHTRTTPSFPTTQRGTQHKIVIDIGATAIQLTTHTLGNQDRSVRVQAHKQSTASGKALFYSTTPRRTRTGIRTQRPLATGRLRVP